MSRKLVYLLRHGFTSGNLERRYLGRRTDESLLEQSIPEAKKAAETLLKQLHVSRPRALRLCSSPMKRARQTAEAMAGTWREQGFCSPDPADIHLIDDLAEIDFGDFEGKTYKELLCDPRYQDWVDAAGTTAFPGGESREAFTERSFRGFLEALGDPEQEETVLIVCHGGNIMAVLSRLTGEDYYAFMAEPLGGYRLDLEMEDERISALTYKRIACGDPAGLDHR